MSNLYCPECDEKIRVPGKPRLGQRFTCFNCGAELEVINLDPVEIDWAFDEPEDDEDLEWDEEEEGEEDFDDFEEGEEDFFDDEED
jgi:lysine biosynthesis protein LysW